MAIVTILAYTLINWAATGKFEFNPIMIIIAMAGVVLDILNISKILDTTNSKGGIWNTAKKVLSYLSKMISGDEQFSFEKQGKFNSAFESGRFNWQVFKANLSTAFKQMWQDIKTNKWNDLVILVKKVIAGTLSQIASNKISEAMQARKLEEKGLRTTEKTSFGPWLFIFVFISIPPLKVNLINENEEWGLKPVLGAKLKDITFVHLNVFTMLKWLGNVIIRIYFARISADEQIKEITRDTSKDKDKNKEAGREKPWISIARDLAEKIWGLIIGIFETPYTDLVYNAIAELYNKNYKFNIDDMVWEKDKSGRYIATYIKTGEQAIFELRKGMVILVEKIVVETGSGGTPSETRTIQRVPKEEFVRLRNSDKDHAGNKGNIVENINGFNNRMPVCVEVGIYRDGASGKVTEYMFYNSKTEPIGVVITKEKYDNGAVIIKGTLPQIKAELAKGYNGNLDN